MFHKRTILVAAAVCVGLACLPLFGAEEEVEEEAAGAAVVQAKYVVVSSGDEYGAVLSDAKLRSLGGHTFLVGKGVDAGPDWEDLAGKTIWISLERTEQMIEFDDLDELKRYFEMPFAEDNHISEAVFVQ